jgi:predicted fused transcriptional regulator/phosphomethylpyrimidine kinase
VLATGSLDIWLLCYQKYMQAPPATSTTRAHIAEVLLSAAAAAAAAAAAINIAEKRQ